MPEHDAALREPVLTEKHALPIRLSSRGRVSFKASRISSLEKATGVNKSSRPHIPSLRLASVVRHSSLETMCGDPRGQFPKGRPHKDQPTETND